MHDVKTFSLEWGGRTLTLETGKLALLADSAVRAQYGDTVVMATVTMSSGMRDGIDYFPLMVDYEEKLYAAGKIKGSRFIKREGRPTDQAVLNARITDRTLRPLFDQRIRNDIQVAITVLSVDQENDPAVLGLIAASTAVAISKIPAEGPAVGLSVAYLNNEFVLNPTPAQRTEALFYTLAGVRDGKLVMMEAEGKEAPEDIVLQGIEFAIESGKPVVELINKMVAEVGDEKVTPAFAELTAEEQAVRSAVEAKAKTFLDANIESLFGIKGKQERADKEAAVKQQLVDMFESDEEKEVAGDMYEAYYEEAFRNLMLEKEIRVDGRKLDELREVYAEVDVLPRVHASALFQRGETQVLNVLTLGAPGDAQIIDGLEPEWSKRYLHHYNFPAYSVGEVRPNRGPSRRDIGHGALAEKALEQVIPSKEEFPYTMRLVSEVLMSNGSSSQASACASTLALMAGGVPIKNPVAGIAMGLVMTDDLSNYKVLTDIQGIEDHSGDMDFKVAGTTNGVTAVQLDIKLGGISLDICRDTLAQARKARLEILDVMLAAIAEPRKELSPYAPRIEVMSIDPERIGELIGPGGKVINGIIEETGVQMDIEDDGTVFITATDGESMEKAKQMVGMILREIEVGETYEGEVVKIIADRNTGGEIGAIVDLGGGKDGMVHVSELCLNKRVAKVSDVLQVGQTVKVVVKDVDKANDRISLSRAKALEAGMPDPVCDILPEDAGHGPRGGGHGGDRGDRRGGFNRGPRRNDSRSTGPRHAGQGQAGSQPYGGQRREQ